jgi:ribosomal protein S18 acetylase RimI-like enzyme
MINVFPADWLANQSTELIPADLRPLIDVLKNTQERATLFLSAMAVNQAYRRRGIGSRLIEWVVELARSSGFERLSLYVWADNMLGRAFYGSRGFEEIALARMARSPRLLHAEGSVLMRRRLTVCNSFGPASTV